MSEVDFIDNLKAKDGKLRYPDPPRTKGIPPQQWPLASELSDARLQYLLSEYRQLDVKQRTRPEAYTEENRRNLNWLLVDLHTEAVNRGWLDDGYQEGAD